MAVSSCFPGICNPAAMAVELLYGEAMAVELLYGEAAGPAEATGSQRVRRMELEDTMQTAEVPWQTLSLKLRVFSVSGSSLSMATCLSTADLVE